MELVSDDIILHEDILAVILASMSFEDLLHKRQIPIFREATDFSVTLDILSRMYNLPKRDTFIELLEEYDKANLTPRCLKYHSRGKCLEYFASIGDLENVIKFEEINWDDFNKEGLGDVYQKDAYDKAIGSASENGHLNIVKYLDEKLEQKEDKYRESSYFNFTLFDAAKGGHKDIIDYFINNGATNWNRGIRGAAQSDNIKLVDFFADKGADWNEALAGASAGCHLKMVHYTIDKGANDWNLGLSSATVGNCKKLINFFIDRGADDWDTALFIAALSGNKELIDFFIGKGATDIEFAIQHVNNKDIKDYLISLM